MNYSAAKSNTAKSKVNQNKDSTESQQQTLLDLILRRVRLRARRRAIWLAYLSGNADHIGLEADPVLITALDDRDQPEAEYAWYQNAPHLKKLNEQIEQIEHTLASESGAAFHELGKLFRLNFSEQNVLQACMAVALDPMLGSAYAYLHQHSGRTYMTDWLAARLFNHGHSALGSTASPLTMWGLVSAGDVSPGEPAPLSIDPLIVDWLSGELKVEPKLVDCVRIVEPRTVLPGWPVENTAKHIEQVMQQQLVARVQVAGPNGSGKRSFAAATAACFSMKTLSVDTSMISDSDWPDIYMRAQRLALLGTMAIVWHGDKVNRRWPGHIVPAPVQFIAGEVDDTLPACEYACDHRIDLPELTLDERRQLWKSLLPQSAGWSKRSLETLAMRYRINLGDIAAVAAAAPVNEQQAALLAREKTRRRLGKFGRLLDCPFVWNDLVIADQLKETLEDYTFEARERMAFWESPAAQRLFPRGKGLSALFSGPPGTGKTMAAQVIAAELNLDLVRVDLASTVSKYIGDTAKHLSEIFTHAQRMNAVLFFDEADALFSKRTDVKDYHDRHANADTGYLLQLLEEYNGIVILASNRKQNIDPAFTRRLRYVFNFTRPEAAQRCQIFSQLITELHGVEVQQQLNNGINSIADKVELSGAQIKTAVLVATFIARKDNKPLAITHLLTGIERELSKEGRGLAAHEREGLLRDG